MKRFRQRLLVLLGLGGLAFLLAWSRRPEPEFSPLTLPDGTKIQVTIHAGPFKHYSQYEAPLTLAVATIPPGVLKYMPLFVRRLAARPVHTSETPTLAVWLLGDRVSANPPAVPHWVMESTVTFWGTSRSNSIRPITVTASSHGGGRYFEGYFFPAPPASIQHLTATIFSQFNSSNASPFTVKISQQNSRVTGLEFVPKAAQERGP